MSGIYVKDINGELYLNIRPEQFAAYIVGLPCPSGWLRFKVKKRKRPARNGLNFELCLIEYRPAELREESATASKVVTSQPETGDDLTT
jgi:hypothetical protein